MSGPPSPFVIGIILSAALLHALWNALIKGSADRAITMGLINLGHMIFGLVLVAIYLPPAAASWPYIAGSTFIHFFYYAFLLRAYRTGDLSQVYPIARGVAPLLVTLGAQIFAGEFLPPLAWAGILLVSFGISTLFFGLRKGKTNPSAIIAALLTGCTIAAYSVVDGMGVREAGSPLGYIGWLFVMEGLSSFWFLYYRRKFLSTITYKTILLGIAGGGISALAYGLAIYAKNLTSLGTVSAIRESSVIIAALIGIIWFGERPWKSRIIAAIIVATGVIVLAVGG